MKMENAPKLKDTVGKSEMLMLQFIMIAPCFFMTLKLDNDAYWLIRAGRDLIQNGIPHTDPLSLHAGLHYVMQQWLTAGTFAFLYDYIGAIGILIFVLIIFISIVLMIFRLCMVISNQNMFVSYVVTIFDVIILFLYMSTRPYPISMLLFLLEIFVLEKYLQKVERRWLIAIPIISLVLINFHGAIWPFFFIIMIPYAIDSFRFKVGFIQGEGYPKRDLLLAFCLAFLAGFINPYGWELMTYLFRSYGNAGISSYVSEMLPPDFQGASGIYVFAILMMVGVVLLLRVPPRLKLRYGLLMLGTVFMSLSSMRNLSLFAICGLPMLAFTLRDFKPSFRATKNVRPHVQKILLSLFFIAIIATFSIRLYESQFYEDTFIPTKAVDFIIENYQDEDLSLFVGYNWGGYAEFRGLKPFIDARAEVFIKANNRKADILQDLIDLESGKMHYSKFIQKYKLNVFLLEREDLLETYLDNDPQYVMVYKDKDAIIFKRKSIE